MFFKLYAANARFSMSVTDAGTLIVGGQLAKRKEPYFICVTDEGMVMLESVA